jgi:hypothetical protein
VQRYEPRPGETIELEPTVKTWLDTVIVPALVREFLVSRKDAGLLFSDTSNCGVAYTTDDKEKENTP